VASLTYTALQLHQPSYLCNLLAVQSSACSTRSSSLVTLRHPPVVRSAIAKQSFYYSAPLVWNSLPSHLCQLAENTNNILDVELGDTYFLKDKYDTNFGIAIPGSIAIPEISK